MESYITLQNHNGKTDILTIPQLLYYPLYLPPISIQYLGIYLYVLFLLWFCLNSQYLLTIC